MWEMALGLIRLRTGSRYWEGLRRAYNDWI